MRSIRNMDSAGAICTIRVKRVLQKRREIRNSSSFQGTLQSLGCKRSGVQISPFRLIAKLPQNQPLRLPFERSEVQRFSSRPNLAFSQLPYAARTYEHEVVRSVLGS